MNERELRDFIRAVQDVQREMRCSFAQANAETARMLGINSPIEGEGIVRLPSPTTRRRRGRGLSPDSLSKADAVAAVAVYFQSVGAGMEQSITHAQRWLGIKVPRQSARDSIARFKASTSPSQYKIQAQWACAKQEEPNRLQLPENVAKVRKRRHLATINPSLIW